MSPSALLDPVPLGIAAGLFVGKQTGVFGAAWLAIRTGVASRPEGASWSMLYGVALLCGIGFTMSLFIGALAFPRSPLLLTETKLGVFSGSLLSALAGVAWLRLCGPALDLTPASRSPSAVSSQGVRGGGGGGGGGGGEGVLPTRGRVGG